MNKLRNRIFLYGAALTAGLSSMALYRYMTETYIDDRGLLISGNLPGVLLWVVGLGFLAVLVPMLHTLGGDGNYGVNFPRSLCSGVLLIAAGVVLAGAAGGLGVSENTAGPELSPALTVFFRTAGRYLPWLAAASMVVLGTVRMLGKRPFPLFSGIVCLFYMISLVSNYRLWSADPKLYAYAYQFLAGVMAMLCTFHRCCCDAGILQRKKLLATGLMAAVCAVAALGGSFQRELYLSTALWVLGSMCTTETLPPDPEEETGEQPEAAE